MKLLVFGLWHLGSVTAASCARYFEVVGLDFDAALAEKLARGEAPIFEPGLDDLLSEGLAEKRLSFTSDPVTAASDADLLWVCYDTPVNEEDQPDPGFVLDQVRLVMPHLNREAIVLLSSQLPVGSCARIEAEYPSHLFAVSPENLRLGRALDAFNHPDRVIVGLRDERPKDKLKSLFAPFSENIIFMSPESAEMVKHGINSFLAASVVFINELACLGEHFGADAAEVSAGLKSDARIGPRAYLRPGGAFAGGTLARDVVTLMNLAREKNECTPLLDGIMQGNTSHQTWVLRRLNQLLGVLAGKNICILGLTYTPNTSTLRRSQALALCHQLHHSGARVSAYDPLIRGPVTELGDVQIAPSILDSLKEADALVVCTEWPEFLAAPWEELLTSMRQPLVLDANRFLENQLRAFPALNYISVGLTQHHSLVCDCRV